MSNSSQDDELEQAIKDQATKIAQLQQELANWGSSCELLEMDVKQLQTRLEASQMEAEHLAASLYKRYYKKESPDFELCDSVDGVISQIDNMVAGVAQKLDESQAQNRQITEALEHIAFIANPIVHEEILAYARKALASNPNTAKEHDNGVIERCAVKAMETCGSKATMVRAIRALKEDK